VDLSRFLLPEELADLQDLAKHRGWTPLLKLLRSLEATALRDLQGFKSHEDAYEKRGFSRGVSLVSDVLRTLYDNAKGVTDDSPSEGRPSSRTSSASSAADAKPSGYSY